MSTEISTPTRTRMKFIPWLTGVLFKLGFHDTSWRLADWYMDRVSVWNAGL